MSQWHKNTAHLIPHRNPRFSAVWTCVYLQTCVAPKKMRYIYILYISIYYIYTSKISFDILMFNPSGQSSNRSNKWSKWWTVQALQVHPGDQILAVNGVSGNWEEPWPWSFMEIWGGTSRFYLLFNVIYILIYLCFLVFVISRMGNVDVGQVHGNINMFARCWHHR